MLPRAAILHLLKGHGVVRLQAGIHIVTPNKKLNSGPLPQYQALRQFQRGSYIHFFYEARTFIPHKVRLAVSVCMQEVSQCAG